MNISKKILRVINEDALNALSFDKGELESSEEFDMQTTSSKNNIDNSRKDLEKKWYSQELQKMLPNPAQVTLEFIKQAIEWHKEYGATYNPHLDGGAFHDFIDACIEENGIMEENGIRINLNWIDTSEVTSMPYLFAGEESHFSVNHEIILNNFNGDISEWDVHNVTDMKGMFMHSKFNGNIANWNISNVEDMSGMFWNAICFNQDLSSWNIFKNVDTMYMFLDCPIKEEYKPTEI